METGAAAAQASACCVSDTTIDQTLTLLNCFSGWEQLLTGLSEWKVTGQTAGNIKEGGFLGRTQTLLHQDC